MKQLKIILLLGVILLGGCIQKETREKALTNRIKVGIFDTNGDSPGCIIDAYEALRIDGGIEAHIIGATDIMSDRLKTYDLVLFPGGSGKAETNRLGELGCQRIRNWVIEEGGAVLGICAGSYILSQTNGYPSLDLSGWQAIDIEHDHRGHGRVQFELTQAGEAFFPELKNRPISFCQYYEGPVLATPDKSCFEGQSLATMLSDVHTVEGTPANMTTNRPFVTANEAGKGRVVSFVGHPECTPGMRWLVPRMVRWATRNKTVSYPGSVVRPGIYEAEELFTSQLLDKQDALYQQLWGTPTQKVEAMQQLVSISAWSAKKWIIGLLRDTSPLVRQQAALSLLALERTDAIDDLQVALQQENNETTRTAMSTCLNGLEQMVGCEENSKQL
ncbi:biofilm PGA synthesis protein PgaB [Marinilabiliaceae bacterium JC017]|nr:biofilm PGA synthesis protein PgaB [Marinilabiliaceae bacterium JC017]